MFPKPGNDIAKGRYEIRIGQRIWIYKEGGASEIEANFASKCCYEKVPEIFSILQFLCIKFKKNPHQAYFFRNSGNPHSYPTRFSHLNYVKPTPKLNKCKYEISYRRPFIWDFLSTTDKEITDFAKFKAAIKSKLLSLKNEISFF